MLKKYYKEVIIAALIILLLLVHTCSNDRQHEAEGEITILTEQVEELTEQLALQEQDRRVIVDSLQKDNDRRLGIICALEDKNKQHEAKIKKLQEAKKKNIDYSNEEVVIFLEERYHSENSISLTEKGVEIRDSVPSRIVNELEILDIDEKIISEQSAWIEGQSEQITELNGIVVNKDVEISAAGRTIDMQKELQEKTDQIVKTQTKSITNLKVKGTVKTIAIVGAFILGVLIAK